MVNEATGGTGSITTDGTEQDIVNLTGDKFYGGYLDLTNMVAGDIVEVREYHTIKSGGSSIPANLQTYSGLQPTDKKLREFPMKPNNHGYRITIKRTASGAGGDKAYDYEFFEV